ncbi:D-inositol 3-phosphate glycosyltransferase [Burkholderiaceae bacterium]|nr:D-inositol 3-phosphate glycosyltransferase [Burkholderiaceae bacterium]
MRVLHAYNLHRGGGGADNATRATIGVLRDKGVEVETFERDSADLPVNLSGKLRAFGDGLYARSAVKAFRERLDRFRPDVVHVHELYPLISPWVLPECTRRGIPTVMSVYDYRLTCPVHNHHFEGRLCVKCVGGREHHCVIQNCRGSRAESLAFGLRNAVARSFGLFSRHVRLYITPTRFTADWLVQHAGVAPANVTAVPCVIDIPETTVDPVAGRYVAFAGRFVPEKGVEVALAAAREARLPLWLAGDADDHPAVRPGDDVHFVRTRNREELAAFYRGARLFVMPSIWFETFGIVVGEAMSHGVPVLASRIGALAETTVDGVTGMLFETGDASDLARKMRRLWDDPELCRSLGRGARRHIEQTSHRDRHAQLTIAAYESVLA